MHSTGARFDVIVFIPQIEDGDKPELLKLIDKIIMRNYVITREHNRFKISLKHKHTKCMEYIISLFAHGSLRCSLKY